MQTCTFSVTYPSSILYKAGGKTSEAFESPEEGEGYGCGFYYARGRSVRSPGSYSIVVRAPVDPGTKRVASPFFILEGSTMLRVFVYEVKNFSFMVCPTPQLLRFNGHDLHILFQARN